ncbi:MAG: flavodoxin-dependent (E)-4-hydroxy-3-methylbut-2-enyl-diphosphate synthase [Oscillospiraceae bacterium]|jgi:(E)-4-hydroxy-3-methylbut-2-enyl-diphosphate synthase|nr:flavodoxin-dependent (E)-4-hydroxy-3-methylbut-2-enyl-diphosphate synthase [Oscillospiraceae bacterium]
MNITDSYNFTRRVSRSVTVGGVRIGGGADIAVQSMTTAKTADIAAVSAQIRELAAAGCDIVRVAVPDIASAQAIADIKRETNIPIVADIHFDHNLAIAAIRAGVDKIRINPGNIGDAERVRAVADAARERGVPIRVGVNGGSLTREMVAKHGGATPDAIVESALEHVELLESLDFRDIVVAVKSSDVRTTIES